MPYRKSRSIHSRRDHPAGTLLVAFGIVILLTLSALPSRVLPQASGRPTVAPEDLRSRVSESRPVPTHLSSLEAATRSLAQGGGPAHGSPLGCGGSPSAKNIRCGPTPVLPRLSSAGPSSPPGHWRPSGIIPPGSGLLSYDPATNSSIYAAASGDGIGTWEFRSEAWWPVLNASTPSVCPAGSMTYDSADGYLLYFGGASYCSTSGQTWAFKSGSWSQIQTSNSPPPRDYAVLAFDPPAGYAVLTGGENWSCAGHSLCNDTWSYRNGTWTNLTPGLHSTPGARWGASMAYDASDSELILFGGSDLNDTWAFRNSSWSRLNPVNWPPARSQSSMTFAPDGHGVFLFGGIGTKEMMWGSRTVSYNDTWRFYEGNWTSVAPQGSFPVTVPLYSCSYPRGCWQISVDPVEGTTLLVGPLYPSTDQGTQWWNLVGTSWVNRTPSPAPAVSWQYAIDELTYDAADGYVLLFGGVQHGPPDYWASPVTWSYSNGTWTDQTHGTQPAARSQAGMVYDAADGYVLLFGGSGWPDNGRYPCGTYSGSQLCGDTWKFLAGNWTRVAAPNSPSNRSSPGMAYDSGDGYVLLQGGTSQTVLGSVFHNDTWTYRAGAWTNRTSSVRLHPGTPAAPLAYDPGSGGVLLQGDWWTGAPFEDRATWVFSNGQWRVWTMAAESAPPLVNRYSTSALMFQDSALALMIYLDPSTESTWTFGGGNWTELSIPSRDMPLLQGASLATYDGRTRVGVAVGPSGGTAAPGAFWTWVDSAGPGPLITELNSSPSVSDVGIPVQLHVGVEGGTPPLTYSWSGLPPYCPGQNSSTLECSPAVSGNYWVSVGVGDAHGNRSTSTFRLAVNPDPQIHATVTPNPATAGASVQLWANVTGGSPPMTFLWSLSDGGTSTQPRFDHTFVSPGTYTAAFTLHDAAGFAANDVFPIVVNGDLTVAAHAARSVTDVGLPLQLDLSIVGGTAPVSVGWQFGDGNASAGPLATHSYSNPGTYTATATAADAAGAIISDSLTILVNPRLAVVALESSNLSPTAVPVEFHGVAAGGTPPYVYLWEFSDGGSRSGANVSHRFTAPGVQSAKVVVVDAAGANATTTLLVSVGAVPAPGNGSGGSSLLGPWAFSAGLLLGIGLGVGAASVVLLRRRNRARTPP